MKVRTFLKPSDSMTRRKASILISFLPPTLMPRRNATYSIISTMFDGDALGLRSRQVKHGIGQYGRRCNAVSCKQERNQNRHEQKRFHYRSESHRGNSLSLVSGRRLVCAVILSTSTPMSIA